VAAPLLVLKLNCACDALVRNVSPAQSRRFRAARNTSWDEAVNSLGLIVLSMVCGGPFAGKCLFRRVMACGQPENAEGATRPRPQRGTEKSLRRNANKPRPGGRRLGRGSFVKILGFLCGPLPD
jgi:hypothetical protein